MYIHKYTCIYTYVCVRVCTRVASRPGSVLYERRRLDPLICSCRTRCRMATGWCTEETRTLLGIWGAADVQGQLDRIVRIQAIYEKIAAGMRDAGYERT